MAPLRVTGRGPARRLREVDAVPWPRRLAVAALAGGLAGVVVLVVLAAALWPLWSS